MELAEVFKSSTRAVVWVENGRVRLNDRATRLGFARRSEDFLSDPAPFLVQRGRFTVVLQVETARIYVEPARLQKCQALELLCSHFNLSRGQAELIWLLYRGLEDKEIAKEAAVKEAGVKTMLYRARLKMGVNSRSQAVRAVAEMLGAAREATKE